MRNTKCYRWGVILLTFLGYLDMALYCQEIEEFKIKRETVFEFAEPPVLKKITENQYTISFETKSFCDVTVGIEGADGKIVRYLGSGVLGKNAPEPFTKDTKKQVVIWDSKNDMGEYVENLSGCVVRVSLGLNAKYESNLLYSPKRVVSYWDSTRAPIFCATPNGMLVYQVGAFDHIRLFDHNGEYKETVYPFSGDLVTKIKGLPMHKFPQSNTIRPLKKGFYQTTLLHGDKVPLNVTRKIVGFNATSMAFQNGKMLLLGDRLLQFAIEGKPLDEDFEGPQVSYEYTAEGTNADRKKHMAGPSSVAFSKDGKFAYLSGYYFRHLWCFDGMHGVVKVNLQTGEKEVFKGVLNVVDKRNDADGFDVATSVVVDSSDRVYVSDFNNDRIQVFDSKGILLKSISVKKPAKVQLDPKTQEIYVFSWVVHNRTLMRSKGDKKIVPTLYCLGAFDSPVVKKQYPITELPNFSGEYYEWSPNLISKGPLYATEIDFYSTPYKVWIGQAPSKGFTQGNTKIYAMEDKELKLLKDFGEDVKKVLPRPTPPVLNRQRLYVNPASGLLYVGEADGGVGKSFKQLIEINPKTQKSRLVDIPFDSEDMCFDIKGYAYLRSGDVVARYDSQTWREIPWDYGAELTNVSFDSMSGHREANLISGLKLLGDRGHSFWHLGGMHIAPNGNLVITNCHPINTKAFSSDNPAKQGVKLNANSWQPPVYPGRFMWGMLTVYDKYGNIIQEDAFPGIGMMNGVAIDNDNHIYAMVSGHRLINGKQYDPDLSDDLTDTLVKVKSGASKVISDSKAIPLVAAASNLPKRSADIFGTQASNGKGWIEGAEWFYGGVGFAGKNASWDGGGCCCWNARFTLDYYSRSFVPELRHFTVGVLDKNGNLILRIGKYGNEDDGVPLNKNNSSPRAKSIGGDEVALFHGAFLGTDTDKNLYIADEGNNRIISVKLEYQTEVKLNIKE